MSDAIMISVQPDWCELIGSGQKTIEIRKRHPRLKPPFKCYIYLPKAKTEKDKIYSLRYSFDKEINGKVIGEFICDKIYDLFPFGAGIAICDGNIIEPKFFIKEVCLSEQEIINSLNSKGEGFGWHISNLIIYEKPKELNEFWHMGYKTYDCPPFERVKHPPKNLMYVNEL